MSLRRLAVQAAVTFAMWSGIMLLGAEDNFIRWLDNYKDAIREARSTQKPIFLEFRCEP